MRIDDKHYNVCVRLPKDHGDALQAFADRHGFSVSRAVREVIDIALGRKADEARV